MKEDQTSYFDTEEFKEIMERYERMLRTGSVSYFDALELSNIADYYQSIGFYEDADRALQFGFDMHPADSDLLITKAHGLLMRGKSAEARQIAESLPEQGSREVLFLEGCIDLFDEDVEMADLLFSRAIEADEADAGMYFDIIAKLIDYCQYDKAQQWIDKAMLFEPESKSFHELQADLYDATQNFDKAIEAYNRLIDEYPYDTYYWEQLAMAWYHKDDAQKALECFDFLEAIDPDNEHAPYLHVQCLFEEDRIPEARFMIESLLKDNPDSVAALTYMGTCCGIENNHIKALGYLTKAAKLDPDDPVLQAKKGVEQYYCGKYKLAAASLGRSFKAGCTIDSELLLSIVLDLTEQGEADACYRLLKPLMNLNDSSLDKVLDDLLPPFILTCWLVGKDSDFRKFFKKAFAMDREKLFSIFGIKYEGDDPNVVVDYLIEMRDKLDDDETETK